jgi:phytoene dehydrogenase-like protein
MSDLNDAIVIGGGVNGLVAATYLARAGKRVTLLEATERLGGLCAPVAFGEGFSASVYGQTIHAFDHRVIKDLNLVRHGLKFLQRDIALVGSRAEDHSIVLQRDVHATAANIAVHSQQDAEAWPRFRREVFDLGRAMRPFWFGEKNTLPTGEVGRQIDRLSRTAASAWLDFWFESDALKAALCFDATADGFSPVEAGSALVLVWSAAQEMWGLQGAVSRIVDGTLVDTLASAARAAGVTIQTGAPVQAIETDGETATGVRLQSGHVLKASHILCDLPSDICAEMMPPLVQGIAHSIAAPHRWSAKGEAWVLLALSEGPVLEDAMGGQGARYVVAETIDAMAAADRMARAGQLPDELTMEITFSSGHKPSSNGHIVSLLIRPVPRAPSQGWRNLKAQLVERAVRKFEEVMPGTAAKIVAAKVFVPDELGKTARQRTVTDILSNYEQRIRPLAPNLLFCSADAEPVSAVSGRAARIAANLALGSK